ncbi:hypothetical protein BDF19DRAFT_433248 [Syncephalis fuscata]|nr:hypothetical protein BDF19DRAFT_433248 [Syncephalis fuscata]
MAGINRAYRNLNTLEYFELVGNPSLIRDCYKTLLNELFFDSLILLLFIRNTFRILLILHTYKYKIAPLCCLAMSFTGVVYMAGFSLQMKAFYGPSCHTVVSAALVGLTINAVASSVFMIQHAYLVHNRSSFLIFAGVLSSMCCIGNTLIYWRFFESGFTKTGNCHSDFPSSYSYARYFIEGGTSTIFFTAFMYTVYQQYIRDGAECWSQIARKGVLTILQVLILRLIFTLSLALKLLGDFSSFLLIVDWACTSTLLSEYTYRMDLTSKISSSAAKAKGNGKTYSSLHITSKRSANILSFIKSF